MGGKPPVMPKSAIYRALVTGIIRPLSHQELEARRDASRVKQRAAQTTISVNVERRARTKDEELCQ
jgi:hypothetical protein